MWKRWLPLLLVAQVFCLVVMAILAVRQRAAQPVARVVPAEWPYKEAGNAQTARVVAPPVPFRTDHPPADAFNLRPIDAEEMTGRTRGNTVPPALRRSPQDLPPGTKSLELNGATVYYDPLGH